jgi:hypothetical protein
MRYILNSLIAHITSDSKAAIERNEMARFASEETAKIQVRGFSEENDRSAPKEL